MAQTSRFNFSPYAFEPGTAFPQLLVTNTRPMLAFDASTDETCQWTAIAPQGLTGGITVKAYYCMASATSGTVVMGAAIEAITDGDTTPDLDSASSFAAATLGTVAVPGTAGVMDVLSIAISNTDSIAAGDYFRVLFYRDADSASDGASGDCYLTMLEVTDGN